MCRHLSLQQRDYKHAPTQLFSNMDSGGREVELLCLQGERWSLVLTEISAMQLVDKRVGELTIQGIGACPVIKPSSLSLAAGGMFQAHIA